MPSSVIEFPAGGQSNVDYVTGNHPSPRLSARVAVGVDSATRTMTSRVHEIDHADEGAKRIVCLILLDVISRASMHPGATVSDLMEALVELAPEDAPDMAKGGAA